MKTHAPQEEDKAQASVHRLDPATVRPSKWSTRHEHSFSNASFLKLKAEIRNAGANVQPIEVRVAKGTVDGQPLQHEIVFGHRRHRACLELGLEVNAVVVLDMNDHELFEAMERENRQRKNLSAWEQGEMYRRALDAGMYPNANQLAMALGVKLSNVSTSLKLARLPADIVSAFASPLDLQHRWAKELADAFLKDPDLMLATAKSIQNESPRPSPVQIFKRLVGQGGSVSASHPKPILVNGNTVASVKNHNGCFVFAFEKSALSNTQAEKLESIIADLLLEPEVSEEGISLPRFGSQAVASAAGSVDHGISFDEAMAAAGA